MKKQNHSHAGKPLDNPSNLSIAAPKRGVLDILERQEHNHSRHIDALKNEKGKHLSTGSQARKLCSADEKPETREEELIVDIDYNPDGKGKLGKALCDSVTRETYDYLVNKGRHQILAEVEKIINEDVDIQEYVRVRLKSKLKGMK